MSTFLQFIRKYSHKIQEIADDEWDYNCLLSNPQVTLSDLENILKHTEWANNSHAMRFASCNPNLTLGFVRSNTQLHWEYMGSESLLTNPCFDWVTAKNPKIFYRYDKYNLLTDNIESLLVEQSSNEFFSNYWYLCNPNVNLDFLKSDDAKELLRISSNSLNRNFIMAKLSENPCLTWNYIVENKRFFWDFGVLSKHPCLTLKLFQLNPQLPWDYFNLSMNPNFTFEIIQSHPEIDWQPSGVSLNPNIFLQTYLDNPDYDWNIVHLARNSNFSWDDLQIVQEIAEKTIENTRKQIVQGFSQNPNLTIKVIEENIDDEWDWKSIVENPMNGKKH